MDPRRYVVGIDVGSYSIGFAAVELDDQDQPTELLSIVSHLHDSGLDPDQQKTATTRLASSGVARRTRRRYRRIKKRIRRLETFLNGQGWKTLPNEYYEDPYFPWKARIELAKKCIDDPARQGELLSVAIRHIAHHRGWRNPYQRVQSLYSPKGTSDAFKEIKADIEKAKNVKLPEDATVAQLIAVADFGEDRIRGGGKNKDKKKDPEQVKSALISARLQQCDHALEINKIFEVQGLDDALRKKVIDLVFEAESPKGAQVGRVGKDPLQPNKYRALKASDAFQRYRIAALLGNLRIRENNESHPLNPNQFKVLFDYLVSLPAKTEPEWILVAEQLDIDRGQLQGTATITDDGERAGARPPVHDTNRIIEGSKAKELAKWWKAAPQEHRDAMLKALSNADNIDLDSPEGAVVQAFFVSVSEEEHEKLDSLHLPFGRAAYSEDTLRRLTKRMVSEGVDLYTARRQEFGIPEDWAPPAQPVGEPVGNPAVDRVLKEVARWLDAAADEWGAPQSVVIEHVRDGFSSESVAREIDRENNKRAKRNNELFKELNDKLGTTGKRSRADLWRYQSVQRQNSQCAYCGSPITFQNCEMDHIVPQKGEGSTNTRDNLVAVCHRCNLSKSNAVFSVWAKQCNIPGVSLKEAIDRTRHWNHDPGQSSKDAKKFTQQVIERLRRTTQDEPLDARSIESVAWMANELRSRIAFRFQDTDTKVNVYRGVVTAQARMAAGISDNLRFVDGTGKSRFDRRHHAVDAAVVSLLTPYVAQTLALRSNMKRESEIKRTPPQWKEFTGSDAAHRAAWARWQPRMHKLGQLLQDALTNDRIAVKTNLRLRIGNGRAHEDSIGALATLKVSSAIPAEIIDRAASEALWCALTSEPDFDWKDGLPANPERSIRVNGTHFGPDDEVEFFPVAAGAIKVRGGYAEISRFHHARVYRIDDGKKSVFAMLRVYSHDAAKFRNQDVFTAELTQQTISMRQAEPKLRKALREGTATYLGWIVTDDELHINPHPFNSGKVGNLQQEIGPTTRWRVDGFYSNSGLRLRPLQLSAEGLKDKNGVLKYHADVAKVVDSRGWITAVNVLWGTGDVVVVRRDALGRVRLRSAAHLPITWKA